MFYVLKSKQDFIQSQATNAIPAHLPTEAIESVKIPIPPLTVQEEIVKILDTFTELEARQEQYEYYRDELLTFGENIRKNTLSEIAHFKNGKGHEKNIDENGKYIVVNSKFVSTEEKSQKIFGRADLSSF